MRRWVCPLCSSGVNGLERPRRDDVRRYCLDCSVSTGRLVERTCPSLEKKRSAQSEKAVAKRNRRRLGQREASIAQRSHNGFDMQAEAFRMWRLPVMREQRRWRERLPEIDFRHSATKTYSSGRSFDGRVVLTMGSDHVGAREVLLHELVHEVLPRDVHHGGPFFPVLLRAAREAWPHVTFPPGEMTCLKRAWDKDEWIRQHLAEAEANS